jgi:mono/diheme cytochrome c family protein
MVLSINGRKLKPGMALGIGLAMVLSAHGGCAQIEPGTPVAEVFKNTCSVCHGEDGAGSALGRKFRSPDLRSKLIQSKPQDELVNAITKGKNKMPAFGPTLSHEQIQALVEYVRHLGAPAKTASK